MSVKRQPSGSVILTTIFLLFGILSMSLIGLEIIMSGLAARRAQGASTRAFAAAETGIERALMAFEKFNDNDGLYNNCFAGGNDHYLNFGHATKITAPACSTNIVQLYFLGGIPEMPGYWVKVTEINERNISLHARGSFLNTSREIFVKFCLPTCVGKSPPADDGCGGTCK